MLTTKNTGLVSGVGLPPTPLVTVKALRGFFYEGKPHYAGEIVEVPERFAISLVAMHKAERFQAPQPAQVEPAKLEPPKIEPKEEKPQPSRKRSQRVLPEE